MQILPRKVYPIARLLFEGVLHHLAVEAILAGEVDADILVNHRDAPRIVLTRTRQRLFLAGDAQDREAVNMLQVAVAERIIPQLAAEGISGLAVFFSPAGWAEPVTRLFPGWQVGTVTRRHYLKHLDELIPGENIPDGFELREVDRNLLENPSLKNIDALREEMCSERNSVEEFLHKSFGIVALHGDTLAGWCLSEYNCGGACEIGIGTQEPFRRRGLARAMGFAFLRQAQQHGIRQVGWDCFAKNTPSVATALSLGYKLQVEYPACVVWQE